MHDVRTKAYVKESAKAEMWMSLTVNALVILDSNLLQKSLCGELFV